MRRILTKDEWRRRRRRRRRIRFTLIAILALIIFSLFVMLLSSIISMRDGSSSGGGGWKSVKNRLLGYNNDGIEELDLALANGVKIKQDHLTPNQYSRPQIPLYGIHGVVIHYTANPGTSAKNNRSYFEGLARKKNTYASSHYIIGLEGEVIQCIPLTEIAYASNERNSDTVAIECCIPDDTGRFNEATYSTAVALTAALCVKFDLKEEDIIRHYDITGKNCPKYFVEHEDAWQTFKKDVITEVERMKSPEDKSEK
jgi:N-acetylmuramoyl-L-alanine amidase